MPGVPGKEIREMSKWNEEQENQGIPIVERTYKVRLPSGRTGEINRFDLNLRSFAGDLDSYIQLRDTSWIKARKLTIVDS